MTKFLKDNAVATLVTLALLVLPLLLPFPMAGELVAAAIALLWMSKAFLLSAQTQRHDEEKQDRFDESLNRSIDAYVDSLHECIAAEVTQFGAELQQLKAIVADAVVTMSNSFNNLHRLTEGQSAMVYSLITDLDGEKKDAEGMMSFAQFAQETDKVLRFFIDHILQISKQSMEMVGVINDVGAHMAHVEKLLSDVQKIADQTNLLALNAAIEAARAGEAGRGFAVVADEVRNLSRNSDKFSDEIKTVVNASKSNIREAQGMIEIMASKDMNVAISSKASIDKMMSDIAVINAKISQNISELSHLTGMIETNVGSAVRGLQFEDMARQLIEYLQNNMGHFQAMADEISIGLKLFKTGDRDLWENELNQGVNRLRGMRQQWGARIQKNVSQSSMDEGDVELF